MLCAVVGHDRASSVEYFSGRNIYKCHGQQLRLFLRGSCLEQAFKKNNSARSCVLIILGSTQPGRYSNGENWHAERSRPWNV